MLYFLLDAQQFLRRPLIRRTEHVFLNYENCFFSLIAYVTARYQFIRIETLDFIPFPHNINNLSVASTFQANAFNIRAPAK